MTPIFKPSSNLKFLKKSRLKKILAFKKIRRLHKFRVEQKKEELVQNQVDSKGKKNPKNN